MSTIDWEPTGDKNADQLRLFTSSDIYDCTLKVGSENDGYKVFKCHKAFLSAASKVFHKIFYGFFMEAKKGPDDPILINNESPAVFEAAMMFVYGNVEQFGTATEAIEIYRFANKMQISSLAKAAEKHMVANTKFVDWFTTLDLFKLTYNQPGVANFMNKRIFPFTAEAFQTPSWLTVSPTTVEMIVCSDYLSATEIEILQALIKWGTAQLKSDDPNTEPGSLQIRAKIDPFIKEIRFRGMPLKQFAYFCTISDVLTHVEKYRILLCLNLCDAKYLPSGFSKKENSRPWAIEMCLPNRLDSDRELSPEDPKHFKFKIDKKAALCGFQIECSEKYHFTFNVCEFKEKEWENSRQSPPHSFSEDDLHGSWGEKDFYEGLEEMSKTVVYRGNSSTTGFINGKKCVLVQPNLELEPNQEYVVEFFFHVDALPQSYWVKFNSDPIKSYWLTLTTTMQSSVRVQSLYFANKFLE